MRFRLVPKASTLDDLELMYVGIFTDFCRYTAAGIVLRFTRRRRYTDAVVR